MTTQPELPTVPPEIVEQVTEKIEPARTKVHIRLRNPEGNPGQVLLVRDPAKKKICCAGRRFGKTTGSAILAVTSFFGNPTLNIPPKRVLYAAPTADQVNAFWSEVKRALKDLLAKKFLYKNETQHIIQNSPYRDDQDFSQRGLPRIRAKTAYNAEGLRGDYADLLILDEFQNIDETALSEVGYPMLMDTNGDLVLIFTPPSLQSRSSSRAKDPQHATKLFKSCKNDPDWLCIHGTSHDNPHLDKDGLKAAFKNMSSLAYRQEILAQDIDEVPGSLWKREWLENTRFEKYNPVAA